MASGASNFGQNAGPRVAVPAANLSSRRDLPLRVRNLLAGLISICSNQLVRPLAAALDEFEQALLARAGNQRDSEQSQRLFESLRQIRRSRIDAGPKFLAALEQGLARFDHRDDAVKRHDNSELALLDSADLDEALALQEIASRAETRLMSALHDLGHRFGVLAAMPAFDIDHVPLGPARLLDALRATIEHWNVPTDHRVLLYPGFDRAVIGAIEASQTEVAMQLKSKTHLGEPDHEEKQAPWRKPAPALSAQEQRALDQIKTLPFGTWFEFAVNQQGDRVRRKLSWYSTVTGHCLFVNPRGARAFERTLQQLARDMATGQANVAPAEKESLIDRAWHTIMASLRQIATRAAESRPGPM